MKLINKAVAWFGERTCVSDNKFCNKSCKKKRYIAQLHGHDKKMIMEIQKTLQEEKYNSV